MSQVIFCTAARTTLTGDLTRVEEQGVANVIKALEASSPEKAAQAAVPLKPPHAMQSVIASGGREGSLLHQCSRDERPKRACLQFTVIRASTPGLHVRRTH